MMGHASSAMGLEILGIGGANPTLAMEALVRGRKCNLEKIFY